MSNSNKEGTKIEDKIKGPNLLYGKAVLDNKSNKMRTLKILMYLISSVVLVLVFIFIFGTSHDYLHIPFVVALVALAIVFFLNSYVSKRNKSNSTN